MKKRGKGRAGLLAGCLLGGTILTGCAGAKDQGAKLLEAEAAMKQFERTTDVSLSYSSLLSVAIHTDSSVDKEKKASRVKTGIDCTLTVSQVLLDTLKNSVAGRMLPLPENGFSLSIKGDIFEVSMVDQVIYLDYSYMVNTLLNSLQDITALLGVNEGEGMTPEELYSELNITKEDLQKETVLAIPLGEYALPDGYYEDLEKTALQFIGVFKDTCEVYRKTKDQSWFSENKNGCQILFNTDTVFEVLGGFTKAADGREEELVEALLKLANQSYTGELVKSFVTANAASLGEKAEKLTQLAGTMMPDAEKLSEQKGQLASLWMQLRNQLADERMRTTVLPQSFRRGNLTAGGKLTISGDSSCVVVDFTGKINQKEAPLFTFSFAVETKENKELVIKAPENAVTLTDSEVLSKFMDSIKDSQ